MMMKPTANMQVTATNASTHHETSKMQEDSLDQTNLLTTREERIAKSPRN